MTSTASTTAPANVKRMAALLYYIEVEFFGFFDGRTVEITQAMWAEAEEFATLEGSDEPYYHALARRVLGVSR